jgi:predicted DNA-binding protein
MKRTHIFLPERIIEALKRLSAETGLSVAELIRRAIDMFLKHEGGNKK